jgi:hypothetical protein
MGYRTLRDTVSAVSCSCTIKVRHTPPYTVAADGNRALPVLNREWDALRLDVQLVEGESITTTVGALHVARLWPEPKFLVKSDANLRTRTLKRV